MSSDTPVLYSMDISPPCRAVLMTIKALSLDVEIKTLDLTKEENKSSSFMHLNHLHKIPTLSHEDLTITDSHAICTYLFNRFSPTSLLYPQSPKSRARVDQMLCFDMCHLFARNSAFMNDFFKNGRNTDNHELVSGIEEIYGFLDKFCMKSKWLAGEQITLADLCCGASVSSAVLLVPLDKILYPSAADWFQRCNEESLFKDVNQPGVENLKKLMKARSSY